MFSDSSQKKILQTAEDAIRAAVSGGEPAASLDGIEFQGSPGIFVTIRKGRELRGCIGRIRTDQQLATSVADVAVESAMSDPRFEPVGEDELDGLSYEVTVLSELKLVELHEIEVGRHGVQIESGGCRAIFLPQVAAEEGWSLDEMLRHLCRKAGLPDEAWRSTDANLYAFEAEVFGN